MGMPGRSLWTTQLKGWPQCHLSMLKRLIDEYLNFNLNDGFRKLYNLLAVVDLEIF